jgi:hypothetical protein
MGWRKSDHAGYVHRIRYTYIQISI